MLLLIIALAAWPAMVQCAYEYGGVIAGSTDGADNSIAKYAMLQNPSHIAFDATGILYFTDKTNHRVCKITSTGKLVVIAGTGIEGFSGDNDLAVNAKFSYPSGIAINSKGDIIISDFGNNRIRKITKTSGIIETIAGDVRPEKTTTTNYNNAFPAQTFPFQMDNSGLNTPFHTLFANPTSKESLNSKKESTKSDIIGDNKHAKYAIIDHPVGIAVDKHDNIYIADKGNHRIRKINAKTNIITTIAGGAEIDGFGMKHFCGDGNLAVNSKLYYPADVAVDATGNVYIADSGNSRVRKVDSKSGIIETIAGIAGSGFSDNKLAIDAKLHVPVGVDVDINGNVYIADKGNNCIRKITKSTGVISTIAGTRRAGISVEKGVVDPQAIMLNNPGSVTVDSSGNVYIADTNNHRIRKLNVK